MLSWGQFSDARPGLASAGRDLLYQFGVGLAFLGTVRADGAPRVHPIAPLLFNGGLFGFIEPTPKLRDLVRDGRYALHSYPRPDDEDAFYLSGRAIAVTDEATVKALRDAYAAERGGPPPTLSQQTIVEFLIETCLLTRTTGHADFNPQHTIWHAKLET